MKTFYLIAVVVFLLVLVGLVFLGFSSIDYEALQAKYNKLERKNQLLKESNLELQRNPEKVFVPVMFEMDDVNGYLKDLVDQGKQDIVIELLEEEIRISHKYFYGRELDRDTIEIEASGILTLGLENNVPVTYFYGVIKQESWFNPNHEQVVKIRKKYFKDVGLCSLNTSNPEYEDHGVETLKDPMLNMKLGVAHIREEYEKNKKSWRLALVGYVAGSWREKKYIDHVISHDHQNNVLTYEEDIRRKLFEAIKDDIWSAP